MALIRWANGPCWLGEVLVAWTDRGLRAVLLGDDPADLAADLARRLPGATVPSDPDPSAGAGLLGRVGDLIAHPGTPCDWPLDLGGTPFQRAVWGALREIPPGTTTTYAALATALGRPSSVRAVASACGANLLAVVIPCHRVVRSGGALAGYRWGIARKAQLLQREQAATAGEGEGHDHDHDQGAGRLAAMGGVGYHR